MPHDWGGTETVILETTRRLLAKGHFTEVLCTTATANGMTSEIDGVRVRRFPYFYPYIGLNKKAKSMLDRKGGSPFSFSLLRALSRLQDLDLMHLHVAGRLGGIGRYAARKRRVPYIISLHGGMFDVPVEETVAWTTPSRGSLEWGKVLGWWVGSRRVLDDAAAILCVGYREQELVRQRYPNKCVIHLPNGVDLQRFARGEGIRFRERFGIPPDAYVVLTVGRIDPQKNQLLPASLLAELRKVHPKTHLLFVGSVTNQMYYDQLTQTIAHHGLQRHVTIVRGMDTSDIVDAYHAADVFLLPSIHEPFGIVILEAWAARTPVLASRVGGIRHLVEHGQDALLFEPKEEKTLLEAFDALVSDSRIAIRIAEQGLRKARNHYNWEAMTDRLLRIYENVVRGDYPE